MVDFPQTASPHSLANPSKTITCRYSAPGRPTAVDLDGLERTPFYRILLGRLSPEVSPLLSSKSSFGTDMDMATLADRLDGRVVGDSSRKLTGLSSLAEAGPHDLAFYSDARYRAALKATKAGGLITQEPIEELAIPQIVHPDPFLAFVELVDMFFPDDAVAAGIHPLAYVDDSAQVGSDVTIFPFACVSADARIGAGCVLHSGVYLGRGATIGEACTLWPNVVIRERVSLGARVIVHPGAVLGADGFGFARREATFIKVRHVGSVTIEDEVEIGANTTIDRGTLGDTVIGRGVKIDNLVHIAHNVHIGEGTAMAAQSGVSGSTVIGKRVLMGGQVGMVDHLSIGDDAVLTAQSGVIGDVPESAMVSGYPARPHREVMRSTAELRRLSKLRRRVRALEEQIRALILEAERRSVE